MQLRTLLLGGVAVIVGYFVLPDRRPEPPAAEPRAVRSAKIELPKRVPPPPRVEAVEYAADNDELQDAEEEGTDDSAEEQVIEDDPPSLQGYVSDHDTHEPVIGCTVVVTASTIEGAQVALTDEAGYWKIPLAPGNYTVTYYYLDTTIEHRGITVYEHDRPLQVVDLKIDTRYWREIPPVIAPEPPIEIDTDSIGVSFSGATLVDNTYIIE
jgi:hypothetical protein